MTEVPNAATEQPSPWSGWLVGTLVVVAILIVGAALWFKYHP